MAGKTGSLVDAAVKSWSRLADIVSWPLRRQRWAWGAPLVIYWVVRHETLRMSALLSLLIGGAAVIFLSRRPRIAITTLIVGLPFSTLILAGLYKVGVPGQVARDLGHWKETMLAALAVAALRTAWRKQRSDITDRVILSYLALGTAYLLLPGIFVANEVGAHLSWYARELGWRSDVLYLPLFLVGRYLDLSRAEVETLLRRTVAVCTVVGISGIFEYLDSAAFNHVVVRTIGATRFELFVLSQPGPGFNLNDVRVYSEGHLRIAGALLDYLAFGFFLTIGLGIVVELMVRGASPRWAQLCSPILIVALILSQSRAGILAGAVACLLPLAPQIGRSVSARARLSIAAALSLAVLIPIALRSGLLHRFANDAVSNSEHSARLGSGIRTFLRHPLGRGLATSAGGGQTAAAEGQVSSSDLLITENQLLQTGTQLGYGGLVLWTWACILIVRLLGEQAPIAGASVNRWPMAALRNSVVGILVGGLFLQPFADFAVAWTLFLLAGVVVGQVDANHEDPGAATGSDQHRQLRFDVIDFSAGTT